MKVKKESKKAGLKLNFQKTKIMAYGPITSWQIDGETMETVRDFVFLGSQITADCDLSHEIKRCLLLGRKVITNLGSILKSRDITDKGPSSQSYGFSSSHVWMWELDHKESWELKNWWFWAVMLEKTFESPLDNKEIKPANPKGNQPLIFIGRTEVEAEAPNTLATWCKVLTHLKRPWCWERLKVGGEGDDAGWDGWMASLTHGHEFEQGLGVGDGQGSLPCCSSRGCKESDRLSNWTDWFTDWLLVSQLFLDLIKRKRGFYWTGERGVEPQYKCWAEEQIYSSYSWILNKLFFQSQENHLY